MSNVVQAEPYVTRAELAEIMRVSVRTVDRMVRDGAPHETWGRRAVRFLPSEVLQWAREQKRAA